jgi:hypothetical protein
LGRAEICNVASRIGDRVSTGPYPLDRRFRTEAAVTTRRHTKFVREGAYGAEVDVELIEDDQGWSPYLSVDDARKIDIIREALRCGDLETATRLARIFVLTPVSH